MRPDHQAADLTRGRVTIHVDEHRDGAGPGTTIHGGPLAFGAFFKASAASKALGKGHAAAALPFGVAAVGLLLPLRLLASRRLRHAVAVGAGG